MPKDEKTLRGKVIMSDADKILLAKIIPDDRNEPVPTAELVDGTNVSLDEAEQYQLTQGQQGNVAYFTGGNGHISLGNANQGPVTFFTRNADDDGNKTTSR